ncbi:MAG TPA: FAD-dependent oxidoreductase [Candidatus Saccharibacteria bacterium]|nr:FAD-dependent oxidoreductase [Candidatus Saccharibacteria bacterium]
MHTVIVGGGFAGVKAALEISKRNIGKVTLISDEDHFLHHATLYATATGRNMAESVVPLNEMFAGDKNVTVVQDRIKSLDTDRKMVVGDKKSYDYDKLILAIGSVTTFFGISGVAKNAFGIKTLDEVKEFNGHIKSEIIKNRRLDKNYVIIGAGATGIELAGALHEYLEHLSTVHQVHRPNIKITIVEAAPRILPRLSKSASRVVSKRLKDMGIKILVNHKVEALNKDYITIQGKKVPTETAIWTSGVANNPFFAEHADLFQLAPNGRVEVNQYLEANRDIFVLGDNNTVKYSGMAWPALNQATFVAKHLARTKAKQPTPPFKPTQPPSGIPVGSNWAYIEWRGMYAAGLTGHLIRRKMELHGYKQLLPKSIAIAAWRAHDIPEIDA